MIFKRLLQDIGLEPFIITTGKKGYHVTAPIKREMIDKDVRGFALKIADIMSGAYPEKLTTEFIKQKRKDRIFIDVNRISNMQTSISPYSIRALPRLPIASPFEWDELINIDPDSFNIKNPPKHDPWKDIFSKSVSIKNIINDLKR